MESSIKAKVRACGFLYKARGAWASNSSMEGRPNQARGEREKKAHFCKRGGGSPGISMEGVGCPNGGPRKPYGLGKKPLEAWARR